MTDNLILWEIQKIHEALTKTKEEHTLNFRMIKSTEKFYFSEPILNTTKVGLIRLSVYNSVFNVNGRNNQYLYAGTVLGGDDDNDALAEPLSSNSNTNFNTDSNNTNSSPKITSDLNCNFKGIPLLDLTVLPGAYELAELIKEENEGNNIKEPDKNTMKCIMETKQGALSFDVENSIPSLLGFRKLFYKQGKSTSQKIIDFLGFSTINIHCNVISGVKDNGNNNNIL